MFRGCISNTWNNRQCNSKRIIMPETQHIEYKSVWKDEFGILVTKN